MKNTTPSTGAEHHSYSFGQFVLDVDRGALLNGGTDVPLRPKCFEVLRYLVEHHGVLLSKKEIIGTVWAGVAVTDDSLTQCMIQVRKALDDKSKEIVRTVPRRGYLFDIPVEVHEPGEAPGVLTAQHPVVQNRRPSRWSVGAAIVLAFAIAATWWSSQRHHAVEPAASSHNPVAYDLYLKGKFFYSRRGTGDNERAIAQYRKALDIDPGLAEAWIGLAGSIGLKTIQQETPWEEGWGKVKTMLDKALALEPNNAEVHIRLARYYGGVGDEGKQQHHFDRALQLGQNNALVQAIAAGYAMQEGNIEEAIELQRRAAALDPLGSSNHSNLAFYLYFGGYYGEARGEWINVAALNPERSDEINWLIGLSWIMQEQYGEAEAVLRQIPPGAERDQGMALIHFVRGEKVGFDAAIERLSAGSDFNSAFYLAEIFSFQGDLDQSFQWLAEAMDRNLEADPMFRDSQKLQVLQVCPFLAPMREDPRWAEWLASTEEKIARNKT